MLYSSHAISVMASVSHGYPRRGVPGLVRTASRHHPFELRWSGALRFSRFSGIQLMLKIAAALVLPLLTFMPCIP